MGARTDAARAEVVARRGVLGDEVVRLEAAGRAAVDVPSKIRSNPLRSAGLAAGSAFLVLGGPQRLIRRVRRRLFGPYAELPKSMLPKEVEKRLRSMGEDGKAIQGTIEREFAKYLDEHKQEREASNLKGTAVTLVGNVLKPVTVRLGRQLAEQFLQPDQAAFEGAMGRVRGRRAGDGGPKAASGSDRSSGGAAHGGPG